MPENAKTQQSAPRGHGLFGSLKDALAAASRDDSAAALKELAGPAVRRSEALPQLVHSSAPSSPPPLPADEAHVAQAGAKQMEVHMSSDAASKPSEETRAVARLPSAEEAARAVRGSVTLKAQERHVEFNEPPTTRVVRTPAEAKRMDAKGGAATKSAREDTQEPRTQLVRGRQTLQRSDFEQDPVVGWLVVVGGPGLGAFRPIFEGNNTIGRSRSQRIAIDFGDDAISSEEQAYIRYDSADRSFLFVPNLAKTNVVSVNEKRPTGAVELAHMDVITVGRTQLVFVPFCGVDFDWAELAEVKD